MHTQVYTGFEAAHLDFFPILLYHGVICGELHLFAVGRPLHALISYIVNMLHKRSFFSCVDFQLVSVTCGFSLPRPDTYLVIEGFVTHTKWSMKCLSQVNDVFVTRTPLSTSYFSAIYFTLLYLQSATCGRSTGFPYG
jgi:hypothetical protein